ncbi:MAG: metallophosphoesterase [Pseudomonadota bacterium]|nr:metallophosphoesterase [Pseudomonadota bacterium]
MITLIQLSDCHLLKDKDKTGYAGIAPYDSLARVLSDIQNYIAQDVGSQPEQCAKHQVVVLVTGDISGDSSPESYQHFIALMEQHIEPANIEWFVLAGNHDNNPYFEKYVGSRHLQNNDSLSLCNWQIHGMDTRATSNMHTAAGEVKESDIQALEQSLRMSQQTNHLVALHHHILPSNSWMDKHSLVDAQRLVSLTDEYPQIKALLHGHVHSPLRQQIGVNKTLSYASPSTCWQWEMRPEFGVSNEAPGYQVMSLMDGGSVGVKVVRV